MAFASLWDSHSMWAQAPLDPNLADQGLYRVQTSGGSVRFPGTGKNVLNALKLWEKESR